MGAEMTSEKKKVTEQPVEEPVKEPVKTC